MVFSSILFLQYFLPLFLLAYHLVPKGAKNLVILAASIVFYAWGAPRFVFVILGSTILDFYLVQWLYNSKSTQKRKALLATSISLNLGLLAYFKYANFFIETVNQVAISLGTAPISWLNVALPIGISFYTFQTITYSIDVYRKEHAPFAKLTNYLLYIMSFPQMIAGPIVRFNTVADQIISRVETWDDKIIGFFRFSLGLAKKVLVANVLAVYANSVFNGTIESLHTTQAWLGVLAYTFQIYFDFSGYSDMAIGLGRMLGLKFPENFNSPYVSKSISEFWRRWHITLGSFMKNYLYIPLGGNKVSNPLRLYFNLGLVFLISGLWHGASWNFVLWGVFHGLFLILDRLFLLKLLQKIGGIPATIFTFFIVAMGWVVFRLENLVDIKQFFLKLFDFRDFIPPSISLEASVIMVIAIIFSGITYFPLGQRWQHFFFEKSNYKTSSLLALSIVGIVLLILSSSSIISSDFNPFIYFRF